MNVEPWSELRQGDTGSAVTGMQWLLRAHGAPLAADGVFSPATTAAVTQFQNARGLPADGVVGLATWLALVVAVRRGSTGDAVRAVQSFGLSIFAEVEPLVVDGIYGQVTEDRVRQFQQAWGLTADGVAGRETWSYLTAARNGLWPLVKPGASGAMVRAVQYLLRAHGFAVDVDGVYGAQTGGAVNQFDGQHRALFVSDVVGNLTWPSLIIQVGPGSTGDAVRAAQVMFPRLTVDGAFGPVTEAEVREFQGMFGATVDGIVGAQTWNLIMVPKGE